MRFGGFRQPETPSETPFPLFLNKDKTMKKLNTLFAATLLVAAFSAHAAPAYTPAPNQVKQVKTQAPGYFRQMVGDFEVTALYD
ncbi:hypothetical protein GCWU000324_01478 [Kingella oralis ATCC 51147]|uniref:Uncharacterized protein n=1 Tax=Kingella oralis ATCC 51147 TaxID=629741 RepID=C4GKH5_9NEIS|nr:hypothetical protein GCWU000324_01478 [Kingella oralis ATCC 51147]